jgi:hypothetical protein
VKRKLNNQKKKAQKKLCKLSNNTRNSIEIKIYQQKENKTQRLLRTSYNSENFPA